MQKANLKRVRVIENGTPKRVWVSVAALKSGLVNRAQSGGMDAENL